MIDVNLNWKTIAAAAAVLYLGYRYTKGEAAAAAKEVGKAVNPVDEGNIFNRAAESVYSKVTGSEDSPGADVAQWWYGGE